VERKNMAIQNLVGFVAPRVIKYLLSNLSMWAMPAAGKLVDFAGDAYKKNRLEIANWIRDAVPGERFDDAAVRIVDALIGIAMEEVFRIVGVEAQAGFDVDIDKLKELAETTEVFDSIKDRVVSRVETAVTNF
jgi:hypothetical protein